MLELCTAALTWFRWVFLGVIFWATLAGAAVAADALQDEPLVWEGDLSVRMMDGLHVFVERKIAESVKHRPQYWNRSLNPGGDYAASVAPNRKRFRQMIGAVDLRVRNPHLERFGDDDSP